MDSSPLNCCLESSCYSFIQISYWSYQWSFWRVHFSFAFPKSYHYQFHQILLRFDQSLLKMATLAQDSGGCFKCLRFSIDPSEGFEECTSRTFSSHCFQKFFSVTSSYLKLQMRSNQSILAAINFHLTVRCNQGYWFLVVACQPKILGQLHISQISVPTSW